MTDVVSGGKALFVWSNDWTIRIRNVTELVLKYKLPLVLNQRAWEIKIIDFK